jgi:redox-sensitive bicupin YhaK (pirin superfamily)
VQARELQRVVLSVPASDGAGVKLRRSIGGAPGLRHDPFLMLDEFFSDDPNDYLAGFPAHPHRGFETVTYSCLPHRAAGLLSDGSAVRIAARDQGARLLVLAGKPLNEPVVQYGPFVMNTREEIEQAVADYQSGDLARRKIATTL